MTPDPLPHLSIDGFFGTEKYTAAPRKGPDFPLPARLNHLAHGTSVLDQLNKIRGKNEQNRGVTTPPDKPAPIPIEVRGEPGFVLKLESLENRAKGVVANSRTEGDVHVATVQVPEGALTQFLKLVQQYQTEETRGTDKTPPKPKNQDLVARIAEVRLATLRTFWTDDQSPFPPRDLAVWREVWVLAPGDQSPWDSFRMLAEAAGLAAGTDTIRFPDRVVGLVYGRAEQLSSSPELLEMIGEVRRAKENPADFMRLTPRDQGEWVVAGVAGERLGEDGPVRPRRLDPHERAEGGPVHPGGVRDRPLHPGRRSHQVSRTRDSNDRGAGRRRDGRGRVIGLSRMRQLAGVPEVLANVAQVHAAGGRGVPGARRTDRWPRLGPPFRSSTCINAACG